MEWITQPELKLFSRETLDMSWQSIELAPEASMRSRRHGSSRTRPALISSSTSRKTSSSLPLAISRFICSSHSSSFQPCNHAASSARSSNESCSMAVLLSAKLNVGQIVEEAVLRCKSDPHCYSWEILFFCEDFAGPTNHT